MRMITSLSVATVLLASAGAARAGTAFDDFGPGGSFDPVQGYVVSGGMDGVLTVAAQFTAGASGELATIRLALAYITGANAFTASLLTDDGNKPGATVLESFSLSDLPAYGGAYSPETLTSVLHPLLVSGTEYWVDVATPTSSTLGTWNFNTAGANGLVYQTGNGVAPATLPAFAVNVTAVPEPSALALCEFALACLAGYALRRRDLVDR